MFPLLCSFCGKTQSQVDQLIDGPDVCICNECVDLCRAILDEGSGSPAPAPAPDALALSAKTGRIPAQQVVTANRIARAERRLALELGRQPTAGETAAESGIEPDELESVKRSIAELVTATSIVSEAALDPASAIRLRDNLEHRRKRGEPFSRAWPRALRDAVAGLPPGEAASWRRTFNATRGAWAASYSGLPWPS